MVSSWIYSMHQDLTYHRCLWCCCKPFHTDLPLLPLRLGPSWFIFRGLGSSACSCSIRAPSRRRGIPTRTGMGLRRLRRACTARTVRMRRWDASQELQSCACHGGVLVHDVAGIRRRGRVIVIGAPLHDFADILNLTREMISAMPWSEKTCQHNLMHLNMKIDLMNS